MWTAFHSSFQRVFSDIYHLGECIVTEARRLSFFLDAVREHGVANVKKKMDLSLIDELEDALFDTDVDAATFTAESPDFLPHDPFDAAGGDLVQDPKQELMFEEFDPEPTPTTLTHVSEREQEREQGSEREQEQGLDTRAKLSIHSAALSGPFQPPLMQQQQPQAVLQPVLPPSPPHSHSVPSSYGYDYGGGYGCGGGVPPPSVLTPACGINVDLRPGASSGAGGSALGKNDDPDPHNISPLQENRPANGCPRPLPLRKDADPSKKDGEVRARDKLAQRKLRNKESARRYREKQVARRRHLEHYTRTLSEQNRELECLHDRLLSLTCACTLPSHVATAPPPPPVPPTSSPAVVPVDDERRVLEDPLKHLHNLSLRRQQPGHLHRPSSHNHL